MKSKYYTPEIEEFYEGFNYEILLPIGNYNEKRWEKHTFSFKNMGKKLHPFSRKKEYCREIGGYKEVFYLKENIRVAFLSKKILRKANFKDLKVHDHTIYNPELINNGKDYEVKLKMSEGVLTLKNTSGRTYIVKNLQQKRCLEVFTHDYKNFEISVREDTWKESQELIPQIFKVYLKNINEFTDFFNKINYIY